MLKSGWGVFVKNAVIVQFDSTGLVQMYVYKSSCTNVCMYMYVCILGVLTLRNSSAYRILHGFSGSNSASVSQFICQLLFETCKDLAPTT